MHQYGDIAGSYALCCFSIFQAKNNSFGKGLSPLQAFNHDFMKSTRLAMLKNEQVSACTVCYDWEKNGIESPRQKMNIRFKDYKQLYNKTAKDGSLSSPPMYIDFRFGNLCNFKCRMCGSYASSSWAKEAKFHGMMKQSSPNHYDYWTDNDLFWDDIKSIKKYIREIYFAGGEPFVQEGHYKLLELLVNNDCTNVHLTYNTNLSYDGKFKSYQIEELWDKFRKVSVWPSVEGYKTHAEYGRKGLNWKDFEKNVDRFSKYISDFSLTSSIYSIISNLELIIWIKSKGKSFNITNLVNPNHMSTTVLDLSTKKYIVAKYKNSLKKYQNVLSKYELSIILDSLKHMMSRDDSHLAVDFKKYNTKLDLYRNESFESIYEEFSGWYKNI